MAQSHSRRLRQKQDAVNTSLANSHAEKPSPDGDMSFCTVAWGYYKAGGGGVAVAPLRDRAARTPAQQCQRHRAYTVHVHLAQEYHAALQAHVC